MSVNSNLSEVERLVKEVIQRLEICRGDIAWRPYPELGSATTEKVDDKLEASLFNLQKAVEAIHRERVDRVAPEKYYII